MAKIKIQLNVEYLLPLAIIIASLIIAGAIVYTKTPQQVSQPTEKPEEIDLLVEPEEKKEESLDEFEIFEKDHIRGDFSAPVSIVEFSDFQCPFCQRFHPIVQQILLDYSGDVRWVYKHFPLDQIHPQARPAAEASECAAEQGKFWQFADSLFDNQSRLGEPLYKELAENLELNTNQFNNCFSSRKYKDRVEQDLQEGIKAGVTGTPGSFINGEKIPGAVPYDYLKDAVEKALGNL